MMFMMPLAIGMAAGTLAAQRLGANDGRDARRIGWHGMQLGLAIAALMGGGAWLAREALLGIYTADAAIIAAALPLLAWVMLFHVGDAAQAIAAFILRAYRIATLPMLIYVAALWASAWAAAICSRSTAAAACRRRCRARPATGRRSRSASRSRRCRCAPCLPGCFARGGARSASSTLPRSRPSSG
jgi:hypothetical protein